MQTQQRQLALLIPWQQHNPQLLQRSSLTLQEPQQHCV